jgi:hypothetical protein
MAAIGQELRLMYDDIVAEGVPERFAEILRKLDEPGNKGEPRRRSYSASSTLKTASRGRDHRSTGARTITRWSTKHWSSASTSSQCKAISSGYGSYRQCRRRPPNKGVADTLEEAREALAARYEQVKRGQ